MKRKRIMVGAIICSIVMAFVLAFFAILPPGKGAVEPFRDGDGNIIPGSIAEKCRIETDSGELGAFILGKNADAPVLLVCGGGPGIPEYLMEHEYPSCLTDLFVVCYWDYRGTTLSYDAALDPEDMTTERFIEDTNTVTEYLRDRFGQDKIYILGHSFGTYVALNTVSRYPELYEAYFAMSQDCDQVESEYLAYDYMKNEYEKAGNKAMVRKFEKCPIRESDEFYDRYFSSSLRDKAMHELGVGTTRDMRSVITGIFFPSLRIREYTQKERLHLWSGKIASRAFAVTEESTHFNAFTDIPAVDVAMYFFAGEYDQTCSYSLQKEYYEQLSAPEKEFHTFADSAHSPIYEESEAAAEILKEILAK